MLRPTAGTDGCGTRNLSRGSSEGGWEDGVEPIKPPKGDSSFIRWRTGVVRSVSLSHIGPRRNEGSHGVRVPHGCIPEFAEIIKADVTIEATKGAYTDDSKKVTFNGSTPVRTKSLNASAVGAIAFHMPSTPNRTAPEVWPNRERPQAPRPEPRKAFSVRTR